jgi:hypothetical protein
MLPGRSSGFYVNHLRTTCQENVKNCNYRILALVEAQKKLRAERSRAPSRTSTRTRFWRQSIGTLVPGRLKTHFPSNWLAMPKSEGESNGEARSRPANPPFLRERVPARPDDE